MLKVLSILGQLLIFLFFLFFRETTKWADTFTVVSVFVPKKELKVSLVVEEENQSLTKFVKYWISIHAAGQNICKIAQYVLENKYISISTISFAAHWGYFLRTQ